MRRYIVSVIDPDGDVLPLVIPFDEERTIGQLCEEAKTRASLKGVRLPTGSGEVQMRLFSEAGPFLDPQDKLQDVVCTGDGDKIYIACSSEPSNNSKESGLQRSKTPLGGSKLNEGTFSLRVITPQLARKYDKLSSIPTLPGICSSANGCLRDIRQPILNQLGSSGNGGANDPLIVDIYIQDVLIETAMYEMPLSELGLEECLIDGVLNVYAVVRPNPTASSSGESSRTAQNAPQGLFDLRWLSQTDRGCASFLAGLKVFQNYVKSTNMNDEAQENILQVVYHITRFFPLLKVLRTMMSGNKMKDYQVSMLAFSFLELLKEMMIPPSGTAGLIGTNETRIFEGSRLLFGHILDSAKQIKYHEDGSKTALMTSYKTVDFTDAITGNLVVDPVQAEIGIVGRATLIDKGMSHYATEPLSKELSLIFKLSDGRYDEYSYFKYDKVIEGARKARSLDARLITDLPYLSAICSNHKLGVTLPADLHKAEAPCLTMDGTGLLSTYIGRPACAGPGEDYQIQISLTNEEKNIDVGRVTQALEPILAARKRDGTLVFEAPGAVAGRTQSDPVELIMFAVDCSKSMENSSEFHDQVSVYEPNDSPTLDCDSILRSLSLDAEEWNESRTIQFLRTHECFEDMAAVVRARPNHNDATTANQILALLRNETKTQIQHEYYKLNKTRETNSRYQYDCHEIITKRQITELASKLKNLQKHAASLVVTILSKAYERPSAEAASWMWKFGETRPAGNANDKSHEQFEESAVSYDAIPADILCPITREVMEDPVKAADGIIYERSAITRWFESSKTSPSTALEVVNIRLRAHKATKDKAVSWVRAEDLLDGSTNAEVSSPPKRLKLLRTTVPDLTVTFNGLASFTRRVQPRLSVVNLYKVAFRGQKGVDKTFGLFLNGQYLVPSDSTISDAGINQGAILRIGKGTEAVDSEQGGATNSRVTHNLYKIFSRSSDDFEFGFWSPVSVIPGGLSVVFKYWRYLAEKHHYFASSAPSVTFWSGCENTGDGHMQGSPIHSWEFLDGFHMTSTGCLGTEGVYDLTPRKFGSPEVFKLVRCSYRDPLQTQKDNAKRERIFTRLEVSKEIFSSFINRTLAYRYANHCGLLPFSEKAEVTQNITPVLENFREMVMRMRPKGDTPLWDALKLAVDKLNEYGASFPNAKKRIVCLSDGCDTSSSISASELVDKARTSNVVIDSFCLGRVDHSELMWACHNTGGYRFKPENLEDAMGVGEMEPVLSLLERNVTVPPYISPKRRHIPKTPCGRDLFPQRKEHPNVKDSFTKVDGTDDAAAAVTKQDSTQGPTSPPGTNNASTRSNIRTTRILSEIRRMSKHQHEFYDVYVSDSNIGFWKVVMQGPPGSAYSTGCFVLYLDMDEQYPLHAPKARFITPVLHPNINKHGRICHSIFDRNWTTDTSNIELLNTVYGLLLVPEASDPINTVITLEYRWDEVAFSDEVKTHIEKHAKKDRSALRAEIENA